MKEIRFEDGSSARIFDRDVETFLGWIHDGHRPVYFTCHCSYRGTAKLSSSDVAYAATGGTLITCPKCDRELEIRIPKNSHELTQQVLEVVKS